MEIGKSNKERRDASRTGNQLGHSDYMSFSWQLHAACNSTVYDTDIRILLPVSIVCDEDFTGIAHYSTHYWGLVLEDSHGKSTSCTTIVVEEATELCLAIKPHSVEVSVCN